MRKFSKYLQNVKVAIVCGGESMTLQIRQLHTAQIIVGTPGRIMDHMRRRTLSLENLKTVILDEADEMLNMGFVEDIQTILRQAPENRQTVLFSATMPPAILKITKEFQTDPQMIAVDKGQKTVDNIAQFYCNVPTADKTNALKLLLEYHRPKRALIFCNTKKTVNDLCRQLTEKRLSGGWPSWRFEAKPAQSGDELTLRTGVPAFWLPPMWQHAELMSKMSTPCSITISPMKMNITFTALGVQVAQAKQGPSYTLAASRTQLRRVHSLERFMGFKIEEKTLPNTEDIKERHLNKFKGKIKQLLDENSGPEWISFVDELEQDGYDAKKIAAVLCKSFMRKTKVSESLKNVQKGESYSPETAKARLNIDIGTDSKINADFIIGTIVETTGLANQCNRKN